GELFATRCPTCGRSLVVEELVWPTQTGPDEPAAADDVAESLPAARKTYACPVCRGGRGGGPRPPGGDAPRRHRGRTVPDDHGATRARLRDRFPVVEGGAGLVDRLLDLHTPRQLAGLEAILERIEGDLRAAPVEAALRLAFLHALLPASRLNGHPHR